MRNLSNLIRVLADGERHTGVSLATYFGVSRKTIDEEIYRLATAGVQIEALRARGYRIKRRPDLLHAPTILQMLRPRTRRLLFDIQSLMETDSTNSHLMRQGASGAPAGQVCVAEMQTAGKGRRGKEWISPFAANLYMSLLWRFEHYSRGTDRLSLITALAVADALTALGAQSLALKWPNDLYWRYQKLGGILLESATQAGGGAYVVIGIGVNVRMPISAAEKIDQPWADLTAVLDGNVPPRNLLAARLLDTIVTAVHSFEHKDELNLPQAWRRYDYLYGEVVELENHAGRQRGTALGIDTEGRLLLDINGRRQAFACGEIRLYTKYKLPRPQ
jgi:BirA family biotin operon repressor/biotin-[acetyl-CoA-carboxylase] ligase